MAGHDETLTTRDRFRGALLGLAVGEAIGAPAEFLTAEQVAEKYGVITEMIGGGVYEVSPGEAVDATDMMLCLAESLADVGSFDPENVIERYRLWFESNPRHVSLTVRATLLSYRAGTHWDLASRRAFEILGGPTAGNGSLIRCAPLGLRNFGDAEMRHALSHRESTLTHFDRLAGWSCAAFTDLLTAAIHGDLREQVPAIAATLDEEDKRVSTMLTDTLVAEPEELRSSSFVLDTLQTALWTVLHAATFEHAVCAAVNRGGDASAVGAVTGALAGAVFGETGIPPRWLAPLQGRERIAAVAERLADLALTPGA
jgi:ADP-ribosyl-[dinitrogen reductase] hydrolase